MAYEVFGVEAISKALGYLCNREMTLGGYSVITTKFQPRDHKFEPMNVTVYMATCQNDLYLGDQHVDLMASEIHMAKGTAGSNSEYVTKLADFVRNNIPEDDDDHLFDLDQRLRKLQGNTKLGKYLEMNSENSDEELFIDQRRT